MSKDAKYLENCLERLANGDYSIQIGADLLKKKNDAGNMARFVKQIADNGRKETEQLKGLAEGRFDLKPAGAKSYTATVAGTLEGITERLAAIAGDGENENLRIDENKFIGGYRKLAELINNTLDGVYGQDEKARAALKAALDGDYGVGAELGDGAGIAGQVSALCGQLSAVDAALKKAAEGDFSAAQGFKKTGAAGLAARVAGIADNLDAFCGKAADLKSGFAAGDTSARLDASGLVPCLSKAALDVNAALDANSTALSAVGGSLSSLAVGGLAVGGLAVGGLAAESGELSGDYEKLAADVKALSARLGAEALAVKAFTGGMTAEAADGADGKLGEALAELFKVIRLFTAQVQAAGDAAARGDFSHRVDPTGLAGDFAAALERLNGVFGAAIKPVTELSAVLRGFAGGDTHTLASGSYAGALEELKDSINAVVRRSGQLIADTAKTLGEVADGNFNVKKLEELDGDWNGIPAAVNGAVERLGTMVGELTAAVDEVVAGTGGLLTGSEELSRGVTAQASSVEELTASMVEIASQTKLNAQNAGKASSLAKTMRDSAIYGNKEMDSMLTSMQEINDSSKNISKIIKVIDDIAFQTNILALNAAVEAARAGQYGKGFAVVAEEVRNLAARSANAAKDTTSLIEGSIKRVEKGTQIAADTAKTLGGIVDGVDKVAGLVENIAVASNEQATGITQVNQGLEQVAKVVQSNSDTAGSSAAASGRLSKQAAALKARVARFVLHDADAKPVRAEKPGIHAEKPAVHAEKPAAHAEKFAEKPVAAKESPAASTKPVSAAKPAVPARPAHKAVSEAAADGKKPAEPALKKPKDLPKIDLNDNFGKY